MHNPLRVSVITHDEFCYAFVNGGEYCSRFWLWAVLMAWVKSHRKLWQAISRMRGNYYLWRAKRLLKKAEKRRWVQTKRYITME